MKHHYVTFLQIRNNCLVVYELPAMELNYQRDTAGLSKKYSGMMATGAQKRIKRAIDIMLQRNEEKTIWNPVANCFHPFRLGFVTLTVSSTQNIDAQTGYKKLLKEYLRWQGRQGVTDYIWKAELQTRGQLHYHVTINNFLHHEAIRREWNGLQKRAGLLDEYARKNGHFNANSTDVHAVRKVKDIEAYLSKYIAKATQNQQATKGKIWDCSSSLKVPRFSIEVDSETNEMLRSGIANNEIEEIALDRCTVLKSPAIRAYLSPRILREYKAWL